MTNAILFKLKLNTKTLMNLSLSYKDNILFFNTKYKLYLKASKIQYFKSNPYLLYAWCNR